MVLEDAFAEQEGKVTGFSFGEGLWFDFGFFF